MKKKVFFCLLIVLSVVLFLNIEKVSFSEPGSEDDPLVTMSYVEKRIEQIKYYLDKKIDGNDEESTSQFKIVEIHKDESIIGKMGTEIILRGGEARIIGGELGGIADITKGEDLKTGQLVPQNHLLIVPRDDGRGIYACRDCVLMIKGKYEIR